jgi:hypothetical protein
MSDIVKRLNALVIMDEVGSNNQLGKEAAAYIERLEAALNAIDKLAVRHEKGAIGKAQLIARAALQTGGA